MQHSDAARLARLIEIAKAARTHRKWRQKDAGRATGHCTRVISDYETGAKSLLDTFDYALRVSEAAGRPDLADQALLVYGRRRMIGPRIPQHFDPHVAAIHQYAERQRAESNAVFAEITLHDVKQTKDSLLVSSAVEQVDSVEAEWYELETRCRLARITVYDAFRIRDQRALARRAVA